MRQILLTIIAAILATIGLTQSINKSQISEDFFYGTWTDSAHVGFTLTKEKLFYIVDKRPKSGLNEIERDFEKEIWHYKIYLDQTPIIIKLTCKECENKTKSRERIFVIQIMNDRQISLISKEAEQKILLTKEQNTN